MKFKYFNIEKIKESYLEQIEEFTLEYMFLFPFHWKIQKFDVRLSNGGIVALIYCDKLYTATNVEKGYFWEELTVEDLNKIIEQILEPALLKYELHRKGTLN